MLAGQPRQGELGRRWRVTVYPRGRGACLTYSCPCLPLPLRCSAGTMPGECHGFKQCQGVDMSKREDLDEAAHIDRAVETAVRIGLIAVMLALCYWIVRPFLIPIAWGIIIAVAAWPGYAASSERGWWSTLAGLGSVCGDRPGGADPAHHSAQRHAGAGCAGVGEGHRGGALGHPASAGSELHSAGRAADSRPLEQCVQQHGRVAAFAGAADQDGGQMAAVLRGRCWARFAALRYRHHRRRGAHGEE